MTRIVRRTFVAGLVGGALLAAPGPARAVEVGLDVDASASGVYSTPQGTWLPAYLNYGDTLTVTAAIRGGGVLTGDSYTSLYVGDSLDRQEHVAVWGYVVTGSAHGVAGVAVQGAFDGVTGVLTLAGDINEAVVPTSGVLKGATGSLEFVGQAQSDGTFTYDAIVGTITLARP